MPAISEEEKLLYVISVLKNTDAFTPNFKTVAEENNISNANKAQIKFKKIIDDTGKFKLTAGKVSAVDGDGDDASATPVAPATTPVKKGRGRPKKAAAENGETSKPAAKKRKAKDVEDEGEEAAEAENEVD